MYSIESAGGRDRSLAPGASPGVTVPQEEASPGRGDRGIAIRSRSPTAPPGLVPVHIAYPGLAPGATFCRAYGAACGYRIY